jgi:hypothetical protein
MLWHSLAGFGRVYGINESVYRPGCREHQHNITKKIIHATINCKRRLENR